MYWTRSSVLSLMLGLFSATLPAIANDATVGGQGADLVLLNETRIRMVSEEITLVQQRANETDWHVYARYIFENPTADSVVVQMGFPEKKHCEDEEYGDTYDPRFRDLRTDINGVRVETRTGIIPENEWGFCLGNVYVFDVKFAPGERLEIHHGYAYTGSSNVMGIGVDYLTRTGSLWNGPIESATFRVSVLGIPVESFWPAEYNLVQRTINPSVSESGEDVRTEYVFQQKRWLPGTDFHVELHSAYDPTVSPMCCPSRIALHMLTQQPNWEERFREEAACLDDGELRLCRNLVFARYGRTFADPALNRLFYPDARSFSGADFGYDDVPYMRMGYQMNAAYTDELLSEQEEQFVAFLKVLEGERAASAGE